MPLRSPLQKALPQYLYIIQMQIVLDMHSSESQQEFRQMGLYLQTLPIKQQLDMFPHESSQMMRMAILTNLDHLVRRIPFEEEDFNSLYASLFIWFQLMASNPNDPLCQHYTRLFGDFVRHQIQSLEKLDTLIRRLDDQQTRSRDHNLIALRVCRCIVLAYDQLPRSHLNKHFEGIYLNWIMYLTFRSFQQVVYKEQSAEGEVEWKWDEDIELSVEIVRLMSVLLNYNYGKWQSPEEEERAPLLLPAKRSKYQRFDEFEKFKTQETIFVLTFLYKQVGDVQLCCEIIQLLFDISRIHLRFFKGQINFLAFSQTLLNYICSIAGDLRLQTREDYAKALAYATNLNKCLATQYYPNKLPHDVLYSWAMTMVDFLKVWFFNTNSPMPSIVQPILQCLLKINRFQDQLLRQQISNALLEYQLCLSRIAQRTVKPHSGILQIDVQMALDHLSDRHIIEPYLQIFKIYRPILQLQKCSKQELLWRLYQKFTYQLSQFKTTVLRQDSDQLAHDQCVEVMHNYFQALMQIAPEVPRNYMSQLLMFIAKEVCEMSNNSFRFVQQCRVPLGFMLQSVLDVWYPNYRIVESLMLCAYVLKQDRTNIYKRLVKLINDDPDQRHVYYGWLLLVASEQVLWESIHEFKFSLQLANDFLSTIISRNILSKFKVVTLWAFGLHLPDIQKALLESENVGEVLRMISSVVRIDKMNLVDQCNKNSLFELLCPLLCRCASLLYLQSFTPSKHIRCNVEALAKEFESLAFSTKILDNMDQTLMRDFRRNIGLCLELALKTQNITYGKIEGILEVVQNDQSLFKDNMELYKQLLIVHYPQSKTRMHALLKAAEPSLAQIILRTYVREHPLTVDQELVEILATQYSDIVIAQMNRQSFGESLDVRFALAFPFSYYKPYEFPSNYQPEGATTAQMVDINAIHHDSRNSRQSLDICM